MKYLLLCFCLLGLVGSSCQILPPHYTWNKQLQGVQQQVLQLRFKDAYVVLQNEKRRDPQNLLPYLLEDQMAFLQVFATDHEREYEQLLAQKAGRLRKLSTGDRTSPYYLYSQAEVGLQWALLRLRFGYSSLAVYELEQAYQLALANEQRFPDFMPNKKTLGILSVLLGMADKKTPWGGMFSRGMDMEAEGFKRLREVLTYAARNKNYEHQEELQVWYALLLLSLGSEDVEHWNLLDLRQLSHQKSPLAAYVLAQMCLMTGKSAKALSILELRPRGDDYHPFPSLDYLEGLCWTYKLDLVRAGKHFENFLYYYRGEHFRKDAYLRLGFLALIQGDRVKAEAWFRQGKQSGEAVMAVDIDAATELGLGLRYQPELLRLRLLYEGGYYTEAYREAQQAEHKFKTVLAEQVEFSYRYALILEAMQQLDKALDYYEQTLAKGQGRPEHYAAASALRLGQIWDKRGDINKAKAYYQKVLRIKPKMYKKLLHAQAKIALMPYQKTKRKS